MSEKKAKVVLVVLSKQELAEWAKLLQPKKASSPVTWGGAVQMNGSGYA